MGSEVIFEVTEADEGGYTASAVGYGIHTDADSIDELRVRVRDAVSCYFNGTPDAPKLIRLHFVRDELLVA